MALCMVMRAIESSKRPWVIVGPYANIGSRGRRVWASFRHRRTEGSPRRFRLRSADRLSSLAIEGIQGKMSAGRGPGRRREDPDELTTLVKKSVPCLRDLPPLRRQPG